VVVGSEHFTAHDAARFLEDIGARDAVATDQRRSAMLGHSREFTVPAPPRTRQSMQTFGLFCR
jgi:hypothetical protein